MEQAVVGFLGPQEMAQAIGDICKPAYLTSMAHPAMRYPGLPGWAFGLAESLPGQDYQDWFQYLLQEALLHTRTSGQGLDHVGLLKPSKTDEAFAWK